MLLERIYDEDLAKPDTSSAARPRGRQWWSTPAATSVCTWTWPLGMA